MHDVKNKVVVITGASKGLGAALAGGFARKGANVAICARGSDAIFDVERKIKSEGGSVYSLPVDIKNPDQVKKFARGVSDKFQRVDAVINNASVLGDRLTVAEYPTELWREVLDINVNGVFLMTKNFLPLMMKQKSGSIINLSSGVGNSGKPRWGAYSVSKFGVEGFSYMLAEEMKQYSVRVNIVNPGALATEMRRSAYPDEDRSLLRRPEDILEIFLYLVSDKSAGVTGRRFEAQEFDASSFV